MNFTELYKKISQIENGITESQMLDECPCQDAIEHQPKQQDSVNMNISINGQGSNGIRDLMDILRNIESPESAENDEILIGAPADDDVDSGDEIEIEPSNDADDEEEIIVTDDYENSPIGASDAAVYGISAVTGMGDDLASKGAEARKQAGGGNPWNVSESLRKQLKGLYEEIKLRN